MDNELLTTGRRFLILLQKIENEILISEATFYPSKIVLQIRNWKNVIAFILRKLSSFCEGSTDYDFNVEMNIFYREVVENGDRNG